MQKSINKEKYPNVKLHNLKLCRKQIGLNLKEAEEILNIQNLKNIEKGEFEPSFKLLEKISNTYLVPRWVFYRENIPTEYKMSKIFDSCFIDGESNNYKIKKIIISAEYIRGSLIDLPEGEKEMEDCIIGEFKPPSLNNNVKHCAKIIKKWLNCENTTYNFNELREKIESKNILVLLAGKLEGRLNTNSTLFKGFSIYNKTLPTIVINDLHASSSQLFVLLKQLVSIMLKNNSSFKFCNEVAKEILKPQKFLNERNISTGDIFEQRASQYGGIYFETAIEAYHCGVINLNRLCHYLEIKVPSIILKHLK